MKFRLLAIVSVSLLFSLPAGAATPRWFQPIVDMPTAVVHGFQCRIWHESRSTFAHPNLGDNNAYGSSGIFQMEPILWNRWAPLVGVHVPVWRATPYQQSLVAVEVYKFDGFSPWRDGCG